MNRRGVCYDVGRVLWGQDWRPEFAPGETRRELQIIRDDLQCNAVRICGQDLGRLMAAGRDALDLGLEVWLSPELWDPGPAETLDYIGTAAERAEELHRHRPGQVMFSVGSEATLFTAGIAESGSVFERLEHPSFWGAGPGRRAQRAARRLPGRGGRPGARGVPRSRHLCLGATGDRPVEPIRLRERRPVPGRPAEGPVRRRAAPLPRIRAARRDHRVRVLHLPGRRRRRAQGIRHPSSVSSSPLRPKSSTWFSPARASGRAAVRQGRLAGQIR